MRKIMLLGTAAMLVAVGTWAAATTGPQNLDGFSGINTFELVNSKELPAQQYDMS